VSGGDCCHKEPVDESCSGSCFEYCCGELYRDGDDGNPVGSAENLRGWKQMLQDSQGDVKRNAEMARYSLFVLKVPLNPNQPNNQYTFYHNAAIFVCPVLK